MAILLMLAGVLIFGNLLSDLADIGHAANAAEVAKLKKVQSALDLMQHQDVPKHLQLAVIDWIRFHHTHIESSKKEKDLLAKLPLSIQQQLIQIIFGKTLKHIPIFEILGATDSDFLRGVWSVMRYATYEPNATIIPFGAEASRLIVIVKGECEVSFDPRGKSEQLEKPEGISGFFRSLSTPNKEAEAAKMVQLTAELEKCKIEELDQEQATINFNETALQEFTDFEATRSADMKAILVQYAKMQQEFYKKQLAVWTKVQATCSDPRGAAQTGAAGDDEKL